MAGASSLTLRRLPGQRTEAGIDAAMVVAAVAEPSFVDAALEELRDAHLTPAMLRLEVSEGEVARVGEVASALHRVRRLGVQVALDDFGRQGGSLVQLTELPLDVVKRDGRVVRSLHDRVARAAISGVVDLAHHLGMAVVAEALETSEELELVTAIGCDAAFGHLLDAPSPGVELVTAVRELPARPSLPALA